MLQYFCSWVSICLTSDRWLQSIWKSNLLFHSSVCLRNLPLFANYKMHGPLALTLFAYFCLYIHMPQTTIIISCIFGAYKYNELKNIITFYYFKFISIKANWQLWLFLGICTTCMVMFWKHLILGVCSLDPFILLSVFACKE